MKKNCLQERPPNPPSFSLSPSQASIQRVPGGGGIKSPTHHSVEPSTSVHHPLEHNLVPTLFITLVSTVMTSTSGDSDVLRLGNVCACGGGGVKEGREGTDDMVSLSIYLPSGCMYVYKCIGTYLHAPKRLFERIMYFTQAPALICMLTNRFDLSAGLLRPRSRCHGAVREQYGRQPLAVGYRQYTTYVDNLGHSTRHSTSSHTQCTLLPER